MAAIGRVNSIDLLGFTDYGRKLYLYEDGSMKLPGEWISNPDLAAVLRLIARDGADAFYCGEIAARIDAEVISAMHLPACTGSG